MILDFTKIAYNKPRKDEKENENRKRGEMNMKKKKFITLLLVGTMVATVATGCGTKKENGKEAKKAWDTANDITVVSREDGSGTRGAFIELFGIEEKDADGKKVDHTTEEANITNSTAVMMSTVKGNEYAIGYISLGSLDDSVKAIKIDGAEATPEHIKSDTYKISRPFNIVTKDAISPVAQDYMNYIMSVEGQKVVAEEGYIPIDTTDTYAGSQAEGKVVVAGSSSITPVMEKLKEAYMKINTKAQIEIQQSDSTTGVTSTVEGICDIGMVSRELKAEETGIKATVIGLDGIAVVVNKNSAVTELTSDQVKSIFKGDVMTWDEVVK